ncbi:MAG: multicopper oxidase domain-containing protein [Pseudomonadota bacterium]
MTLGLSLGANATTIDKTLCVGAFSKNLIDASTNTTNPVTFWGYAPCSAMMNTAVNPTLPSPLIEVGIGDTLNLTLNVNMMTPQENAPYDGHTIHLHGADVPTSEDGVPETSRAVTNGNGTDTYTWSPTPEMAGTYMYHCHVHTVKHLEMGMYGPLIVRPKDATGNFLNQLTPDAATAYNFIQTYLLSSVDPAYHTAIDNSPVFADYNPKYFLINGEQGLSAVSPAATLTAATNSKVALRLIGLHSINGTFSILDSAGNAKSFTVYVEDGRQWPTPETMTSLDVGPGQRYDIIFNTPTATGTLFPQFEFKKLRDGSPYATAYGKVTF